MRETFEETGIAPGFVSVAGYLDRYLTGTGFDIQPVVGVLADGFALAPDPREVAEIFEVPLAFLAAIPPTGGAKAARSAGRQRAASMPSPIRAMRSGAPPPPSCVESGGQRC